MKMLLESVVVWPVHKISCFMSWFLCIKNRGLYINRNVELVKITKLMLVVPRVIDDLIKRSETNGNSGAVISRIALHYHESDVKSIAAQVSRISNLNGILKTEDIPYRFYTMEMANYFTYKVNDNVTEVYLSKTFT